MPRRDNFWTIWTQEELVKVPEHHKIRLEKEWNFRKACFERDNFTCKKCSYKEPEETIYEKSMAVTVHHIIPQENLTEEKYKHLIYEPENGITFCKRCHTRWHKGRFKFEWKDYSWFVLDIIEQVQVDRLDELVKVINNEKI